MTTLRTAAQQALEFILSMNKDGWMLADYEGDMERTVAGLEAALAQTEGGGNLPPPLQAEPVVRECSDPMCACRGGPCAECEEGQREKEIEDLRISLDFYQRRCEALQAWQSRMRDPERTIVCDILANGFTLDPAFAGNRYTAPPKAEPVEPVAWLVMDESGYVQHAASWRDAAHEHINDAINEHDLVCARTWRVVPVYTAPPQRKPLTEEEIDAATSQERDALLDHIYEYGTAAEGVLERIRKLARATERAHGIGEQP